MRPGWRAFLGAVLVAGLFLSPALVIADENTQTIASRNIATFDDPATSGNWIVQGSKYATEGYPKMEVVKAWPDSLYGHNKENKNLEALGIHGRFDRKSYNYIEIIPAAKDSSGKLQPTTLPLPGRVKSLDMWVWGSNYNFWVDAYIRDYRGIDHVLHLGSIMFVGWKDLSVLISGAIPQARKYIPRYAGLELTKIVLWTAPDEKVDDFYFYVDEINVITDLFESRFDGEDLADPDYVNNLWQQGNK
jgi:hypothetical protein